MKRFVWVRRVFLCITLLFFVVRTDSVWAAPTQSTTPVLCSYCPELCGKQSGTQVGGEYFKCEPGEPIDGRGSFTIFKNDNFERFLYDGNTIYHYQENIWSGGGGDNICNETQHKTFIRRFDESGKPGVKWANVNMSPDPNSPNHCVRQKGTYQAYDAVTGYQCNSTGPDPASGRLDSNFCMTYKGCIKFSNGVRSNSGSIITVTEGAGAGENFYFDDNQGWIGFDRGGDGGNYVSNPISTGQEPENCKYVNAVPMLPPGVRRNVRVESNKGLPEESAVDCPQEEGVGGSNGNPTYNPAVGSPVSEMRKTAGLNFNAGGVRGQNCGQAKSDPIILNEKTHYGPPSESQCKLLNWSGEITINNNKDTGVPVPFAQELGDHWAGTWDLEHFSPQEMDKKLEGAFRGGDSSDDWWEIEHRTGVLKKLLPANKQDQLKCDSIKYIKRKGSSMYKSFIVDDKGTKLTDVPCPPYIANPTTPVDRLLAEHEAWNSKWGVIWSRLSLFPNEQSVGKISFLVCADKIYNTYATYPEVFRLGLASNALFQQFNPEQKLQDFYKGKYVDMRNPLSSSKLLGDNSESMRYDIALQDLSEDQFVSGVSTPTDTLPSVGPSPEAKTLFGSAFDTLFSSVEKVYAQQDGPPGDVLDAWVEIVPGPIFNYIVHIEKTPLGYEKFPGIIGDVHLYIEGGGVHIQNLDNELHFDMATGARYGFLPEVKNQEELDAFLQSGSLRFHAKTIGFQAKAITRTSGASTSPVACNTERSCCGNETKTCTPSCSICSRAQIGPSDTTGAFATDESRHVSLGDPFIQWNITEEGWQHGQPLPEGCNFEKSTAGEVLCTKEHDRVVDVHNTVPFLASIWDQVAGSGKNSGFFTAFKPSTKKGLGLATQSGCSTREEVVFDKFGNFVPNPGASLVSYEFRQMEDSLGPVIVTMPDASDKKILFYRIGGVCNADRYISSKAFMPSGEVNSFYNRPRPTPTPSP